MFNEEALLKELNFKAIRSSGSGGQHVNKVSSKIELLFDLRNSLVLEEEQKELICKNLRNKLTKEGLLILQCQESRSQHRNKDIVIHRFLDLLKTALEVPKSRKKTKVPKSVKEKRLQNKRNSSEKKANRKKLDIE
ncbi:alternative ribosome rescue aminoacyl-tRNA hydrolase ArfB [Hyunsoonleella aestuarii]|uniref:Alternative ribosome rescue aminoacyl-tRNA hydrolase ArfB n=1 Tax=Hyunsoonleella aestuarii TaxID=912802 RepID=A0ABP8EAT8_9FLAO|nr:alternative ribosome rescue aminoacyl-tRNA hydrolase ArfB [Hyunsoonleella aestuarii]